jgi:poly-gamma-glutamate capsule biosynthesis protein CapA/YwtB (metallophosphatase superfamily)
VVTIFACGDVVNYLHDDGLVCSEDLSDIICQADYSICNFEAPVHGYGNAQPKSGPHHSQQVSTISGLKKQGFDHLLLANNHTMDYGYEGLQATILEAERCKLHYSGANLDYQGAYKPFIENIKGLKIGIINAAEAALLFGVLDYFSKDVAGHAWVNNSFIDKNIIKLKKEDECDFVLVFSHAGLEHYSIPQKEWRERYRHFCYLGADAVIGGHPHVPQGFERYENSLIFYSLGNFYFDSPKYKDKEDKSYSILMNLEKGKKINFEPIYHHKMQGKVHLSPKEKRIDLDNLCNMLGVEYEKHHDHMSLEAYHKIRRNLTLSLMPIPFDGKLKSSLRRIASHILGRSKKMDKTVLQLHLFKNEAYYYAAKHALEILARQKHTDT